MFITNKIPLTDWLKNGFSWNDCWNKMAVSSYAKGRSWSDLCEDEQKEFQKMFIDFIKWSIICGGITDRILPIQEKAIHIIDEYDRQEITDVSMLSLTFLWITKLLENDFIH